MKTREKKEKPIKYHNEVKDLMRNYTMEMRAARRSPRIYYANDGSLKAVK